MFYLPMVPCITRSFKSEEHMEKAETRLFHLAVTSGLLAVIIGDEIAGNRSSFKEVTKPNDLLFYVRSRSTKITT